jgi:hypothetical protein
MSDADDRIDEVLRGLPFAPPGGCIDPQEMVAFYEGRLEASAEDAVRAHIAVCRACLATARDARAFVDALAAAPAASRTTARGAWWAAAAVLAGLSIVGLYALKPWRGVDLVPREAPSRGPLAAAPYRPEEGAGAASGIVWRGPEDARAFAKAMEPYARGDYRGAELSLETYLGRERDDDRARFYLAVTRLLLGDADDARRDLELLDGAAEPPLREEARWYLALASLSTGRAAQAEPLLRALARDPGPHRADAQRLLDARFSPAP